ncbi:MAG: ABC transporter substrate-binding protein [Pseudomonadota bacterium]|nr:ABC transporter substrate-binding protein [Pseudomonadota bacterium]
MTLRSLFLSLVLVILSFPALAAEQPVYDRIMKSGTIRCGYFTWPAFLEKDPNTGKFSGIFYDIMEELGQKLKLKIEWAEEISLATMFEGFKAGRYDAICGPVTPSPERVLFSDFTIPVGYMPFYLFSRADDARFDNNFSAINKKEIRFASIDGELGSTILGNEFPLATAVSLPQMSDGGQLVETVATGKADVTTTEAVVALTYMENNPDKLKIVPGGPLRTMSFSLALPLGESRLKTVLNFTLQYMLDEGFVDRIYRKHSKFEGVILRPAKSWAEER